MNKSNPNSKNSFIIIFLIIFLGICGVVAYLAASEPSTDTVKEEHKIKGCYYITDSLTGEKDLTTTLCVKEDNTDFNYKNSGAVTLYNKWYGDNGLYIENNYDETLFNCQLNKEDNNKMKCTSYNKTLGSGTWVWEK